MARTLLLSACVAVVTGLAPPTTARSLLNVVRANDCAGADAEKARAFIVGDEILGRVLPRSAEQLSRFEERFEVTETSVRLRDESAWVDGDLVSLRSAAVAACIEQLRDDDSVPSLRGWRDELLAVRRSFHSPPSLLIERAAAPLIGAGGYGVFVNGYVCDTSPTTPSAIWLGRRAPTKPTWPGLLDCIAAGGVAAGELPVAAMRKECGEEAGIPPDLAACARPAGGVSYTGFSECGWGLKQDNLYTFDLELPLGFDPTPVDGEVTAFSLVPVNEVVELLLSPENCFKPNVGVIIIDFLMRHGVLEPDEDGYLELLGALRNAPCR